MYKLYFSALAAVAFALTPGMAAAQHHGGGGHAGGGHGGGHAVGGFHGGGGHAGGFHAGGHTGGGFHGRAVRAGGFRGGVARNGGFAHGGFVHNGFHHSGYYGGGFYGRHYGYGRWGYGGWAYPSYAGGWGLGLGLGYPSYPSYAYAPSYYYDSSNYDTYPDYYGAYPYDSDIPDYSAIPAYGDGGSPPFDYAAPAQAAPAGDNLAHVEVIVPPDAIVWFGSSLTQQTGSVREFITPPLTPGMEYTYDVTARWTENGKEVTRTRQVLVSANSATSVDFTRPGAGE